MQSRALEKKKKIENFFLDKEFFFFSGGLEKYCFIFIFAASTSKHYTLV